MLIGVIPSSQGASAEQNMSGIPAAQFSLPPTLPSENRSVIMFPNPEHIFKLLIICSIKYTLLADRDRGALD